MADNYNAIRWGKIQSLKRKNLDLAKELEQYTATMTDVSKKTHMKKLRKNLTACSGLSLYAHGSNGWAGITGYMCGEKVCFVCNSQRARTTRRKYMNWFKLNEQLGTIYKNGNQKYLTAYQIEKNRIKEVEKVDFDVMHLTLTVPHSAVNGFRGKQLYMDHFSDALSELRRRQFWKQTVLGGEYGFEFEKKESGLHIHIHGLLFVLSGKQNRNILHRDILLAWNSLTIDPFSERTQITQSDSIAIKKGNRLLSDADVLKLNPQGATFISLSNLYYFEKGKKKFIYQKSDPNFLRGVLEAIKYHFEPLFFNKENQAFNLDLIADVKPHIYGRPLYKKFGCLVGDKTLNISDDVKIEYEEAAEDFDPDTGEIFERDYYIINPALMFANREKIIPSCKALEKKQKLNVTSSRQAVEQLCSTIQYKAKHGQL